mmetsp:Transcript_42983/g.135781  ORF Transcript_42983/g.135781 Transcript_42983/m.135781 type:complete len:113 (+) Transcript_42983:181-519(+)
MVETCIRIWEADRQLSHQQLLILRARSFPSSVHIWLWIIHEHSFSSKLFYSRLFLQNISYILLNVACNCVVEVLGCNLLEFFKVDRVTGGLVQRDEENFRILSDSLLGPCHG